MYETLNLHAESIVFGVAVVLFFMTILVLAMALVSRWILKNREVRNSELRGRLGDLIIRYISGDVPIEKVQSLLKRNIDYAVMLKIVYELGKSLDGSEEERLQDLMDMDRVEEHFLEKFESGDPVNQAKACMFMSRKRNLDPETIPRLMKLSKSDDSILSYAATSAIVIHGRLEQKKKVIRNILHNHNISNLAAGDLLVKFSYHGEEYHRREMAVIAEFIAKEEALRPGRRALLIRIFDELEYFHSVDFLWDYYQSLDINATHPEVLVALIYVLTKFGIEEILEDVHSQFVVSEHANLRRAAAFSMGFFQKEISLPFLKWLVNDRDFGVRYEAVKSLANYPAVALDEVKCLLLDEQEWGRLIGEVKNLNTE